MLSENWLSLWTPPGKEVRPEQPWGAGEPGTQEGVPDTEAPPTPERRSVRFPVDSEDGSGRK